MRTGGLILKKGEAEPCRVKPSTLPGNGGLQMVHLMKWSPDPLREMVTARPGATGSVGSRGSLLPPFKIMDPSVPYTLSLTPSPVSRPATWLPSPKLCCWCLFHHWTSLVWKSSCRMLGALSLGGRKGLHFAFSKLLET